MTVAVSDEVAPVASREALSARVKVSAAAAILRRLGALVAADLRCWWLLTAEPASLRTWLACQSPADRRVPAGAPLLRLLWIGHNWSLGLLVTVLGAALHLAGGGLRYLGGHPVRLWTFLILSATTVVALTHL